MSESHRPALSPARHEHLCQRVPQRHPHLTSLVFSASVRPSPHRMMINKIRPQRTFSPRSFMGDRGIHLDTLGKVRDTMFEDEKIIAPKPWKACKSPIVQRSYTWDADSLFNEAGQEIQTILFQSYNNAYQKSLDLSSSDYFVAKEVEETLEIHFPIFSASPCSSSTPITPPTRSHNPMVMDSSFTSDNDRVPEGAELGLLSVSPPPYAKLF